MKFLRLSSEDSSYFTMNGQNYVAWETPNLNLDNSSRFALSSVVISTINHHVQRNPIIISTSLMDADHWNRSGVISVCHLRQNYYKYNANTLEFWQIDCNRPRQIIFKLKNISISELVYLSFVLAFEENEPVR